MKDYSVLIIGGFGIFWFFGAFFKKNFPNERNKFLRILSLICAIFLFSSGLPYLFSSFQSANLIELFGFIGRVLGLIGCARVLHGIPFKTSNTKIED